MTPLSSKTQQTRKEKKEEETIQPLLLSFLSDQWPVILPQSQVQKLKKGRFFLDQHI